MLSPAKKFVRTAVKTNRAPSVCGRQLDRCARAGRDRPAPPRRDQNRRPPEHFTGSDGLVHAGYGATVGSGATGVVAVRWMVIATAHTESKDSLHLRKRSRYASCANKHVSAGCATELVGRQGTGESVPSHPDSTELVASCLEKR
jgi:hypothetical protein